MHIWAHIFFYLSIVIILFMIIALFSAEGRARYRGNKTRYIFVILAWFAIGSYAHEAYKPQSGSSSRESYQQLGHKVNKSEVKKDDSGAYYTDKDDSKLRYFTSGDDNKVTAAKYVYGADHMNVTDVKNKLSDVVLHDDNLKYTDDKTDSDDFLPKGNSFNVYSPKNKKWYHVSMQRDSSDEDAKVSSFSIWPGKDNDVDDY